MLQQFTTLKISTGNWFHNGDHTRAKKIFSSINRILLYPKFKWVTTSDVFAARGEKFMQFKAVKTTKYFETS